MNKERLIEKMREAIMNSIWIDHVGDIAGVESAAGICAEAALKELDNEWVRVEDSSIKKLTKEPDLYPFSVDCWLSFEDKVFKGYYDFDEKQWMEYNNPASLDGLPIPCNPEWFIEILPPSPPKQ